MRHSSLVAFLLATSLVPSAQADPSGAGPAGESSAVEYSFAGHAFALARLKKGSAFVSQWCAGEPDGKSCDAKDSLARAAAVAAKAAAMPRLGGQSAASQLCQALGGSSLVALNPSREEECLCLYRDHSVTRCQDVQAASLSGK